MHQSIVSNRPDFEAFIEDSTEWWRSIITSHLAIEIAKLQEHSIRDIFGAAVSKKHLMTLNAIYASGRPSSLSKPRPSSLRDVPTTDEEQQLCAAVHNGSATVIQWLIEQGVSADATDSMGAGALHISAAQAKIESARLLLMNRANASLIRRGGSPLHYAIEKASQGRALAMMRLLLEYDPDISARDRDDETVLYRASGSGRTPEVALLLDSGHSSKTGITV